MYKVEYLYRNNTSGNVRCKQASKKSSTTTAATNESTETGPVASTSSVRELADKPRPETKYCKNKKNEFENRIFHWLENETKNQPEPEKLDEVDHAMANMAMMIRRDLTVRERGTLLFELQKYVHDFISLHLDRQQYQQNVMPQQPQQNQHLMFAQEQNQHQQPESFMGMLHSM